MMGDLSELPNIGDKSAARLAAVGVHSISHLEVLGAVQAFLLVQERFPDSTSLNLLWALEGALLDISWLELPSDRKEELRAELRSVGKLTR